MPCKFTEGQLIRLSDRTCPRPKDAPPSGWKTATETQVYNVSRVFPFGWLEKRPGTTADCWPIQISMITFPPGAYICACVFDPVGEEIPALVQEISELV